MSGAAARTGSLMEKRTINNIKTRNWLLGKGPNKLKQSRSGIMNCIAYKELGNIMVAIGYYNN